MGEMTMVERVARAMYEANRWYERGALEVTSMTHGKQEWLPIAYDKLPDDEREVLVKQARAAIEAMREACIIKWCETEQHQRPRAPGSEG